MTVARQPGHGKRVAAGDGVSYGHTWIADATRRSALVPAGYGDGVPRAAGNRASVLGRRRAPRRSAAGSAWTSSWSTSAATCRRPGDEVVLFGPGADGEPTAQDWAEALRHHQLRDRHPGRRPLRPPPRGRGPHERRMSIIGRKRDRRRRGAAGLAAAGMAVGVAGVAQRSRVDRAPRRGRRDARSARCAATPLHVIADDGIDLHAEVDEVDPRSSTGSPRTT